MSHQLEPVSAGRNSCYLLPLNKPSWEQYAIACNPATPPAVLHHLAQKSPPAILERIAENPSTASCTLELLSAHADHTVRMAVSENLRIPSECLRHLTYDSSVDVRYRIAENACTPIEILHILLEDENPYVACRANTTLIRLTGADGALNFFDSPFLSHGSAFPQNSE